MTYRLDWVRGASVTIDLEHREPGPGGGDATCWLQYVPPFRQTMRSPSQELPVRLGDVHELITPKLERLTDGRLSGARSGAGAAPADLEASPTAQQLRDIGEAVATYLTPEHVRIALTSLSPDGLFLYIGTDESLMTLPLELLHDGQDFLCLKHHIGRYINLSTPAVGQQGSGHRPGKQLETLKVLLVTVPEPARRPDGTTFEILPEAEAERDAIVSALNRPGIEIKKLHGREARSDDLLRVLRSEKFHIIHFSGHATYGGRSSSLSLFDRDVSVGVLTASLDRQKDAVLCFINGCETARGRPAAGVAESMWDEQFTMFGLAKPFLDTGAYFLGSSWRIRDESARVFASTFYRELLEEDTPMGKAITLARRATAAAAGDDDPSWASYVFYGDPRVSFVRTDVSGDVAEEPRPDGPPPDVMRAVEVDAPDEAEEAEEEEPTTPDGPEPAPPGDANVARLQELADQYDATRAEMESGTERTRTMTTLVREAQRLGDSLTDVDLVNWFAGSDGQRIMAIAVVGGRRDLANVDLLMEAVGSSRSAFEQYQALAAIYDMLDDLSADDRDRLRRVLRRASEERRLVGTDRGYIVDQMLGSLGPGDERGRPDKLWEPGATLRVGFLDGDDEARQRVAEIASEWTEHANISLEFVTDDPEPDLRVSFSQPGVWSYLGTDALAIPVDQPTISLGSAVPERRAVLRAFGHALGLMNEHQIAEIPWDRDAVLEFYMGEPYAWSPEMVERNVLAAHLDYYGFDKELDPESVMLLPVADELLQQPMGLTGGDDLSDGDKELVARLYPAEPGAGA